MEIANGNGKSIERSSIATLQKKKKKTEIFHEWEYDGRRTISLVVIAGPAILMIFTQAAIRINSREIVARFNCCQKCAV